MDEKLQTLLELEQVFADKLSVANVTGGEEVNMQEMGSQIVPPAVNEHTKTAFIEAQRRLNERNKQWASENA